MIVSCDTFEISQNKVFTDTVDHEITLKILEFVLNLIEKVKPVFLLSSMCIFSESNGAKF